MLPCFISRHWFFPLRFVAGEFKVLSVCIVRWGQFPKGIGNELIMRIFIKRTFREYNFDFVIWLWPSFILQDVNKLEKKRRFMINVCACARIFVLYVCAHEAMQSWVVEWELAVAVEKSILWLLFFLLSSFCFLFFIFSLCIFLCLLFVLSSGVFRCFSICLSLRISCLSYLLLFSIEHLPSCTARLRCFFPGNFQLTEIADFTWKNRRLSKPLGWIWPRNLSLADKECEKWRLLRRKYWQTGNPFQKTARLHIA